MNVKLMKSVGFFFIFIFGISIVLGLYFASNIDSNLFLQNDFESYKFASFNDYAYEFVFLLTSFILSFVGIGLIGFVAYLIFKLVSLTFLSFIMISVFRFDGLLVVLLYILVYALIFLFLYSLFIQLIKINVNNYYYIFDRNKCNISVSIKTLKKSIIIYLFLVIYNVLVLLCSGFITKVVFFLLKV